jgi:hypothetical protein
VQCRKGKENFDHAAAVLHCKNNTHFTLLTATRPTPSELVHAPSSTARNHSSRTTIILHTPSTNSLTPPLLINNLPSTPRSTRRVCVLDAISAAASTSTHRVSICRCAADKHSCCLLSSVDDQPTRRVEDEKGDIDQPSISTHPPLRSRMSYEHIYIRMRLADE